MSDPLTLPPPADPTGGGAAPSIDEILAAKKAPEVTVPIVTDLGPIGFRMRAMQPDDFEQLRLANLPTLEQQATYEERARDLGVPLALVGGLMYNPDTFPPLLLAASCVEPTMDIEQATEIWSGGKFSEGEREALFAAAWNVNKRHDLLALGKG